MKKRILFVGPKDNLPEWATWHFKASKSDPKWPQGTMGVHAFLQASIVYYWDGNDWICCKSRYGYEGDRLPDIEALLMRIEMLTIAQTCLEVTWEDFCSDELDVILHRSGFEELARAIANVIEV